MAVHSTDGRVVNAEARAHPSFVPHRPEDTHRCAVVLKLGNSAGVLGFYKDVKKVAEKMLLNHLFKKKKRLI